MSPTMTRANKQAKAAMGKAREGVEVKQPTMILRISRYVNYSNAETNGARYEDTLQQLWIDTDADPWSTDYQEWRDVPIVEKP